MMANILSWLFGEGREASGKTAKDRMKLMVIHDRYELPPALVEDLRKDLLAVAARYFEIDSESAECVIKSQGNRRAFISAVVPLLKRGHIQNANTQQKGRTTTKNQKSLSTVNS
jgi:cell division topological specificity factor